MVRLYLFLLLAVPAILANESGEEESKAAPDEEFYVTAEQIKEFRKNGDNFFVAFSTRMCPHCQRLGEQIPEIVKSFEEAELDAKFYKLDLHVPENKEFADEHEINGVPTVYLYLNGEEKGLKYEGGREAKDFTEYLKKIISLSVPFADSLEKLEESKASSASLLVAVVESSDSNVDHLTAIARSHLELNVVYTTKDLAAKIGADGAYNVIRSDGQLSLSAQEAGAKNAKQLNQWIKMACLPSVVSFPEGAQEMFAAGVSSILFYIDSAEGIEKAAWLKSFAESVRGRLVVASVDAAGENAGHVMEFFGIKNKEDTPFVRIFFTEKTKQYWLESEVTEESVSAWASSYLDGKVEPHKKSEEVPEDWNAAPVKVLVGHNFEEVALDKSKFVFVKFYAPWCGHCKKLAPEWESLAEKVADLENVVIAKLDSTANDIEDGHGEIRGFPTLRLYKADASNSMEEYSGARSTEALESWLRAIVSGEEPATESHDEL